MPVSVDEVHTTRPKTVLSDRAILRKHRLSLLQVRCQPLAGLPTGETEHFQCRGGVEQRTVNAKPIVESVLGPAKGALGAVDEIQSGFERNPLQLGILHAKRDKTDPFRFL